MMMMKRLSLYAFVSALLCWAAPAKADYVCDVTYRGNQPSQAFGEAGYVLATYYTGANCTGTYKGTFYYCSTGATSSFCANAASCSGVDWLHPAGALSTLATMLQQAQIYTQRVTAGQCGANSGRGTSVSYSSN